MTSLTPSETSSSSPSSLKRKKIKLFHLSSLLSGLPAVLLIVAILVIWQIAVTVFAIPSFILPAPVEIFKAFHVIDGSRWAVHIFATLRVALLGFFVSILIALPLAVCLIRSPLLSKTVYPLLVIIQSTPVVAIAPIVIVAFGSGDFPRILITFLISFFPLVIATSTGLLSTPPELIELSKSLRAPVRREILQIRLPYAVPYIFSALKISITLCVIGAVVAEFVSADKGIGFFLQLSTSIYKIPQAWAGLFVLAAISLILFQLVIFTQKLFFPWSIKKG
ncbi:NitT/TauT family transport system permease protein [Bartonella apihabitans]|uniref:NitT/TauT family transport system permease protein n=1 Tax=Bartonella apihabitans TaxID=2750929 RepID=A0A1U9MCI5_9HYPH|nr:NitT/TauT family transport system permease protein [Bartonella apihabitans]